jgi:trans-aconitate methyltransferase
MLASKIMNPSTSWNPESYAKNARFVSDLGEPLLQLLEFQPNELILDLGCGDGALTEKIANAGCTVMGIDSSLAQLQAARQRSVRVALMDGERLGFRRCFNAVFTNAALHWMKRPELVVEGIANSLKPGGRFVGEFGGKGNVETIRSALHDALRGRGFDPWKVDPWYYPSPDEYTELLKGFGFAVTYIELIPRPTKLPGDITAWLEIFAQPFTQSLEPAKREGFVEEVRVKLEPELKKSDGAWYADYVRLRFKATR